jgi:hypothetical protein
MARNAAFEKKEIRDICVAFFLLLKLFSLSLSLSHAHTHAHARTHTHTHTHSFYSVDVFVMCKGDLLSCFLLHTGSILHCKFVYMFIHDLFHILLYL